MEKEILIFGHKNPDTDSICSAMVKERLNKKNGYDSSVAVRLGNINKETQYVLNYLNLEAPELKEEVAEGQKCERCWKYSTEVGENKEHPTLCHRCAEAIK